MWRSSKSGFLWVIGLFACSCVLPGDAFCGETRSKFVTNVDEAKAENATAIEMLLVSVFEYYSRNDRWPEKLSDMKPQVETGEDTQFWNCFSTFSAGSTEEGGLTLNFDYKPPVGTAYFKSVKLTMSKAQLEEALRNLKTPR